MELNLSERKELCGRVEEIVRVTADFIRGEKKIFHRDAVRVKSRNSLVSHVDEGAEQMLTETLLPLLPNSKTLAEEFSSTARHNGLLWVIDPLDGTTNFIHDVPVYSISVALLENEIPILGVVLEIVRDECFTASLGGGAFLNGEKIHVNVPEKNEDALIATGFPYENFVHVSAYLNVLREMMLHSRGVRRLGSAAVDLAYTACGRFDFFFEYNLNAWDVAAGALIVQEAGGVVTDFSGGNDFLFGKEIAAGSNSAHTHFLKIIRGKFIR